MFVRQNYVPVEAHTLCFFKGRILEYWNMQDIYCTENNGHLRADRKHMLDNFVLFSLSNIVLTDLYVICKNM